MNVQYTIYVKNSISWDKLLKIFEKKRIEICWVVTGVEVFALTAWVVEVIVFAFEKQYIISFVYNTLCYEQKLLIMVPLSGNVHV